MSLVLRKHPTCQQIVEVVTSYLEGAMAPDDRDHFEMHLATCTACVVYYDQILAARRAAPAIQEEGVEEHTMNALLTAFRSWKEGQS